MKKNYTCSISSDIDLDHHMPIIKEIFDNLKEKSNMGHKFKIDISIHIDDDSDKFFGDVFMSDMKK